jgi:hypothetical protein
MAVTGLAILAVVLTGLAIVTRRRGDRMGAAAVAVSVASLIGAVLTTATMPIGILGITPHQLRWLWPISLFVTFTILVVLTRMVRREVAIGATLVAVVVLSVAAIPRAEPAGGPAQSALAIPLLSDIAEQLREAGIEGPVVFDPGIERFAEPYTATVQDQLDRLGIDVRVEAEGMLRQVGDSRAVQGDETTFITLREGPAALEPLEGAQRIAFATSLAPEEFDELDRLEAQLVQVVDQKGVQLSELGRGRLAAGTLFPPLDGDGEYVDPGVVIGGGLASLFVEGFVEIDPEDVDLVRRWSDLRLRRDYETIAVFARPLSDD